MTESEYREAVNDACQFPWRKYGVNRYPSWNAEFLRRLSERGLKLEPAEGAPPKEHYVNAPYPMEGEADGWPEKSWIVEA